MDVIDGKVELVFDKNCKTFENDPTYNYWFLRHLENYWNEVLIDRVDHTVHLNEVIDSIAYNSDEFESEFQSRVGWHDDGSSGVYIDFGLMDEKNKQFIEGKTPIAVLIFNTNTIRLYN